LAKNINLKVTKEGAGLVSEFTEVWLSYSVIFSTIF
jgi:hypothetical protein